MKHVVFVWFSVIILGCSKNDLPELNNGNVGESAHDLLAGDHYTSLEIEIQYMPGYQLQAGTLNNFQQFLEAYLNKPAGIFISQHEVPSGSESSYSLTKIKEIESENRTAFTEGNTVAVYVLIVDGAYNSPSVLGVAYRNTSACLFGRTIHENSGNIGQVGRVKLETTVLHHEMGHLLGLVNVGTPMVHPHENAAGGHCNNNSCLMYYAVETTEFLGFLLSGPVPVPDSDCVADMQANGGM